MATSSELNAWLRAVPGFQGAQPENYVESGRRLRDGESVILNYSPLDDPRGGTHWVAAAARPGGVVWFDSFGLQPDAEDGILKVKSHFRDWLASHGHVSRFWPEDWQDQHSYVCGLWCAAFVKNPRREARFWVDTHRLKSPAFRDYHVTQAEGGLLGPGRQWVVADVVNRLRAQ